MTTPVGPKGFALSRDWWLSGSAWHTKTVDDVWEALEVKEASPADRDRTVRNYYDEHPDRLEFVPTEMRGPLGLKPAKPNRKRLAILTPDASDQDIDAFVDFLKADD